MRDAHAFARTPIDRLYRGFAAEVEGSSPAWGRLCRWIADSPEVSARLDALPGSKRQANLFLGALKYLGGPIEPGPGFAAWVAAHWGELERVIRARSTQTNEPGRCAVLAPVLACLPQPITLLEVGSSAGLCLLPDRYRYRYSGGPVAAPAVAPGAAGADAPVLDCAETGTPPGDVARLAVAARAGLDLNPLDPRDPDDARWLRALVWPGEDAREARLASCLALAAQDPPPILVGDLRRDLDALLGRVVPGTTPVLQHCAVLAYLPRPERDAFVRAVLDAGVHWVSYEGPSIVTSVRDRLTDAAAWADRLTDAAWADRPHFVVALDGEPVARASFHGSWVNWR